MLYVTIDLEANNEAGVPERVRRLVRAPVQGAVGAQAVIESVLAGCQEDAAHHVMEGHAVRWCVRRDAEPVSVASGRWQPGEPVVVARALYAVL